MNLPVSISLVIVSWIVPAMVSIAVAQQELAPLTDDQAVAMNQITQRVNTATISFLASDELKGRGTGTSDFQVAAAYVASRFRGAGLVGYDGSYFQMKMTDMVQTPRNGAVLEDSEGHSLSPLGALYGGESKTGHSGEVEAYDTASEQDSDFKGPVFLKAAEVADGTASARLIINQARRLKKRGATALIVPVPDNSPLLDRMNLNQSKPRMASSRSDAALPVLLIPDDITADSIHHLVIPSRIHSEMGVSNVIGILAGSDPELASEAVLFSAHLDHLGQRENGTEDSIYNGADDNASGVTGVLALADAFGALPVAPKRTTIFIAYWGEERGLLGSKFLVENPIWPLEKIVANINLEMIGRPEPGANGKVWMTGWEKSDLGTLMKQGASRANVEFFEHPQFSSRLYRQSDNWSFVKAGVIAHSFSAGSLHSDYHQPTDVWEKLDVRHMTLVCKGLFAASLPIADGILTPTAIDKKKKAESKNE